jgi:divalent metal cation (Fe/Co/Zn/Cd) transporter
MDNADAQPVEDRAFFYQRASVLALITIVYNTLEGVVSIMLGLEDETLALLGFGVDSFVEVISGIGIWHMIRRLRQNAHAEPDAFERQALRITGAAFYMLSAGLLIGVAINVYQGHKPDTTVWGIVVALVSIMTMWLLVRQKLVVGRRLNSPAILADAACTKACMYLSVVLLISSAGYEITGIGGLDSIGAAGIAWFSFSEGKEAFEKAAGLT